MQSRFPDSLHLDNAWSYDAQLVVLRQSRGVTHVVPALEQQLTHIGVFWRKKLPGGGKKLPGDVWHPISAHALPTDNINKEFDDCICIYEK